MSAKSNKQRTCQVCQKTFANRQNRNRHCREVHNIFDKETEKGCYRCPFKTTSICATAIHFRTVHDTYFFRFCNYCCKAFDSKDVLNSHYEEIHGLPAPKSKAECKQPIETAFNGALKVYSIPGTVEQDLLDFMLENKKQIDGIIKENVEKTGRKVQFCVTLDLEKNMKAESTKVFIRSPMQIVYQTGLSESEFLDMVDTMLCTLWSFTASGSGWTVDKITQLEIKISVFNPIKGSSYIAVPGELQDSRALLNIRNHNDHNCFLYCFTAAWHLKNGPLLYRYQEDSWRRKTSPLTYASTNPLAHQATGNFEMPMGMKEIPKFEQLNNCKVNIFR